jgi:hypothetical protein
MMNIYECLNVIDDDVYNAIYYVNVNFKCLNVIDDDVYDATYCENVIDEKCNNCIL